MQRQLRSQTRRESTVIVGDKSVGLFRSVNNLSLNVHIIERSSINAIDRRKKFRSQVTKLVRELAKSTQRWVFSFGVVDVNCIYYDWKFKVAKCKKGTMDLHKIATAYVNRVAHFPFADNSTIIVLGLYPSPSVRAEDVIENLHRSYSDQERNAVLEYERKENALENRQKRISDFNKAVQEAVEAKCKELQKTGRKLTLQYCDVFDKMIDNDTHRMLALYKNIKDPNSLHMVGDKTIDLWLEKWDWLRAMNTSCNW